MHNPPLILVVDDAPEFLEIVGTRLRMGGFAVKTADNATAVMEIARNEKPDLILLDINMPGINGTEALLDFKKDPVLAGIKVAFLTDVPMPWPGIDDKEKFTKEMGAVAFFDKSKDLEKIGDKIRELLKANQ